MFENLPQLISEYGYWVLFLGALLEGETVVVLAGVSARLGLLDLRWVFAVAVCGAFAGDQSLFWIGRGRGEAVAARLPRLAAFTERANRLIARHPYALVLGLRFAYGLRTPLPILIGASRLSAAALRGAGRHRRDGLGHDDVRRGVVLRQRRLERAQAGAGGAGVRVRGAGRARPGRVGLASLAAPLMSLH